MNALFDFFSPEAGQARRRWLNEQEQRVGNALAYYLGPAAEPIAGAAQIAGMLSPGADMMDAADASRAMWNADNPLDAAVAGATMAGAAGMMFLPGNVSAMREGFQSTVDDIAAAYDPALVRAGVGPVSETPAQEVARLLSEGRAAEVTDEMMARVDPQEMWRLYESGATGADMPMDLASRMARATDMGFDTQTPLYHGTRADFPAFDPARAGEVGADFGPASYTTTSPTTASGYAGQATGNPEWLSLSEAHDAALSDWGRAVVQYGQDAPEALRAQDRAQAILDKMNAIQAEVESFRAPSIGGNVMPLLANQSRFPRYEGGGGNWYEINSAAIADARSSNAPGLRIENVIDPATTPTREVADTVISFDPTRIRSQFARFDPRLSHLANLSAGIGGVAIGLNALAPTQENADRQVILDWLNSQGL